MGEYINIASEILKYLDSFGTRFSFYTERNRKFYTMLGGILTLFSIIFSLVIFIFINLDDILHNTPISTTSTERENYKNITFGEEKIWIAWRITDFGGKTFNHTGILFPIIYYYKGIRNHSIEGLEFSDKIINYKLCNETSMANNVNQYMINVELDKLYCIDMDDLSMGGSWDNEFLNYVEFDIYNCRDGINYNAKNENCTTYEKMIEIAGKGDCFEFEMFYPVVHYQPMNKTTPIIVKYTSYFYHLSRYSNKIDRIYLQQHILKDDIGWITKNEKLYSYWGSVSLSGDSYAIGNETDLMNEGSTSRLYSFNIYLKYDIIYYKRSFKKFYLIIANGLPIVNIVFIFFKMITKIFKISSGNKKLTELLFENLQKKKIMIFDELKFNYLKLNQNNTENNNILKNLVNNINTINKTPNKSSHDLSTAQLIGNDSTRNVIFQNFHRAKKSIDNQIKLNLIQNSKKRISDINHMRVSKFFNNSLNASSHEINDKKNKKLRNFRLSPRIQINKIIDKKNDNNNSNNNINNNINHNINNNINNNKILNSKSRYVKKTLFPYKFYLCSIFIKNIDFSKKPIFFTKKFISVYNFICQLFDISSYLILQREFEIMKNIIMVGKDKDILENRQKINVNDQSFNIKIKECLDSQKFSILGRVKHTKSKND